VAISGADGVRAAVDGLLSDDSARADVAAAGRAAVAAGTYRARMRELLEALEPARAA
jgi:hypothetical protein